MQDGYVGDIGDFSKYGLLRYLCGITGPPTNNPLRLGVVWYLNRPTKADIKKTKSDGSKIQYLNDDNAGYARYRCCDLDLYDTLRHIVNSKKRSVIAIHCEGVLYGAQYHSQLLPAPANKARRNARCGRYQEDRTQWLNNGLRKLADADLVFLDPDNGIKADDVSPKHVSIAELRRFREKGKSLVVYHHWSREYRAEVQIECMARCLRDNLDLDGIPQAMRWRGTSGRVYFIIPASQNHEERINQRLEAFRETNWMGHKGFQR